MGYFKKYKDIEKRINQNKTLEEPIIDIHLNGEEQIFNQYASETYPILSNELMNYIREEIKFISPKDDLTININCCFKNTNSAENAKKMFKAALKRTYEHEVVELKKTNSHAGIIAFILFVIGGFFVFAEWLLKEQLFFSSIFAVASWVFVWSSIEMLFFDRNKNRIKK